MAKVLLAVAATAAVGVAAFVLTQKSSGKRNEDEETDIARKIQPDGATSAKNISLRNGNASGGSGKEKQDVGSPKAFETGPEPNGVSDALLRRTKSKDGLKGDKGSAPVAKPSDLETDGGARVGNGSEAEGESSQRGAMPKAVENDHARGVAAKTGGDLVGAGLSPIKARTTVGAAGSDGHDEGTHSASRLQAYEDFALTPPDSPPAKVVTPVKGAEVRAVRSSSGMAELVLKKVPSRGSSMEIEKARTPKAESPSKAKSSSEVTSSTVVPITPVAKNTPVAESIPVAKTKPSPAVKQVPVTPLSVKAPEAESKADSGEIKVAVATNSGEKSEAKREDTGKSASSAVVEKDASTPAKSAPAGGSEKPSESSAKIQKSEAPTPQPAVVPKDAPAVKQPSPSVSAKSDAAPAKSASANGSTTNEKKPANLVAANAPVTAGKAPVPATSPPKEGQATVQKETPVSSKPSSGAHTKSPPKHPQSQTKSSIPAPPTHSERKISGSYADMAKPVSGKSPSNSFSSPPPDGARFGFVAKLPKLGTSTSSSRSNSVPGSPTPVSTQVGFEIPNPKPEVADPKPEVADSKPTKALSPAAAAFVPAAKSEAGSKVSEAVNGKPEEGDVKVSEEVKGNTEEGNVGSGESVAEDKKADRSKGPDALTGASKDQGDAEPSAESGSAVKSVAASRADAAGLSLPISIPGSVTGGEKEELLSEAETETDSVATTPATTPAHSPNQKGGYIEGVVWNADKTAKNKAKRDKKKAKKSKGGTTPGAS